MIFDDPPVLYPYRDDHLVGIHTKTRMVVAHSPGPSVCGGRTPLYPILMWGFTTHKHGTAVDIDLITVHLIEFDSNA